MFDLEEIKNLERTLDYRNFDEARCNRWKQYFENDNDLANDHVLKNYQVSESELQQRRYVVETLLDNVARESATPQGAFFEQATVTSNIATFTTMAVPLIRKIWPRLFAFELCSVQPTNQPNARAFTVDFRYDSAGGAYAAGTSIYNSEDPDYSDDLGEGVTPRKLDMNMTGATITTVAKKLITDWSIEALQDAKSQHGLMLDREIMKMLALQIEREINRELIDNIDAAATTNTNWSSTQPASPSAWSNTNPREFDRTIWEAFVDANTQIYNRIYQDANVAVVGSTMAARLEKLDGFSFNKSNAAEGNIVGGPNLFGTLDNRIKVYKDPYYTATKALLAHKSPNWLYTGYVHLPYLPMWMSPEIAATNFTFAKGVMQRYGNYAKNGDFFATVTIT